MKKILITGGSGFIGTNLVEHYSSQGNNVLNIDIARPRNLEHTQYWKKLDICDKELLCDTVNEFSPDIVLHMAARTDLNGESLRDYQANTDGVRSMIKAVSDLSSLNRIIFASSMLVCPLGYIPHDDEDYHPTTIYGESKVRGEQLVKAVSNNVLPWTIIRPTSLWGPWFGVPYRNFFDAVASRMYMHPKGRRIRRSYGFVLNAVHQIDRLSSCVDNNQVEGKVFYIGDYQPVELYQWASYISSAFGLKPPREVPYSLLKLLALLGDALKAVGMRNPPLSSFRLNNLITEAIFDMSALEKVVGGIPYDFEQGVELTVNWMRAHP